MNNIIIAILGSGAFSALIGSLTAYLMEKQKEKDSKNDIITLMCASDITLLGESAIKDGYIEFAKARLFKNLYDSYKKLPTADGYVDLLNSKVSQLPIKEKDDD